jgi:hypothetical protein
MSSRSLMQRNLARGMVGAFLLSALSALSAGQARARITEGDLQAQPRAPFRVTASLGVRADLIRGSSLDPFSAVDDISQSALSVGYLLSGSEREGLALGFEWNHGTTAATARGSQASLTMDRLTLAIEGRLPLWRRLCGFARFAPGLLRDHISLVDLSAPAGAYGSFAAGGLHQYSWVPAADVSGGLALRLGELRGTGAPVFGFWLTTEGGYGYAGAHDVVLGSRVETQPGRVDEPLRLGQLALRGAFLRFRLAVSF